MIELVTAHPIAAAAITVASIALALVARVLFLGYPPPTLASGALLTRRQQAIVAACADTFFPPGGAIPVSGTEAGLVPYMNTYVRRLDARGRFLVGLLFTFLELGPFVFGPRARRFSRLPLADRLTMLAGMGASDTYFLRVAFLSMRTMLTMGYLSNARVANVMHMQVDPAPFEKKDAPRAPTSANASASSAVTATANAAMVAA